MYKAFTKSRVAIGIVVLLTLALSIAVWIRNRGHAIYIPILATALLLAIGCLTARLIANLVSSSCLTNLLGILHMDLDPETFIRRFSVIPDRISKDSRDYVIASFYLSDGYAAAGRFEEASKILAAPKASAKKDLALEGTYYSALLRNQIGLKNFDLAKKTLIRLNLIIKEAGNTALAHTLQENADLYRSMISVFEGNPLSAASKSKLDKAFSVSTYQIRRLELLMVFAKSALLSGDKPAAAESLEKIIEFGGSTYYRKWAEEEMNEET